MNIKVYEIVQYEYADSLSRLASRLITCRDECPLVIRYMRELALTLIRHDGMRPLTSQSGNRPLFTLTISMTWALQDPDPPVCV